MTRPSRSTINDSVPSFDDLVSIAVAANLNQAVVDDLPVAMMVAHAVNGIPLEKKDLPERLAHALRGKTWTIVFEEDGCRIERNPPLIRPS